MRARLAVEPLAAPEVLDLEVVSALRRLCSTGQLDRDRARLAVDDLRQLDIERVTHVELLDRCWELRNNATAYDAAYVALAEALGMPLLTADRRLAKLTPARCEFEVL